METNDTIEHATENIKLRRESENERYMKYYGLHIYDMSLYDIVIDTTDRDAESVFKEVLTQL